MKPRSRREAGSCSQGMQMIPIKYIGHRETYRDGCYGSGLVFAKGQTINIEDEALARKLLRHADVYVLGDEGDAGANPLLAIKADDDSDADPAQDMRDSIMAMDKSALGAFAKTHFSVDIDKRQNLSDLRTKVVGLFDQFGVE